MSQENRVRMMLASRGLPYKSCGLNADWCVSAWHLSKGQPNTTGGDFYLLDTEETDDSGVELYEIVTRTYTAEDMTGNDTVEVVQGPGKLESVVNRWVFGQPNTDGKEQHGDTAPDGEQQGV